MLLGSQLTLPDGVWMRLNQAWIAYCALHVGGQRLWVMNFSTEFWVDFKLFGVCLSLDVLVGHVFTSPPHQTPNPPVENPHHEAHHVPDCRTNAPPAGADPVHHRPGGDRRKRTHAGHAGSNGTDFGTHFGCASRHLSLQAGNRAWPSIALCMMRCRNLLTRASTHSPLKFSEAVCSFW